MEIDISELNTDSIKNFDKDLIKGFLLNFLIPLICFAVVVGLVIFIILPVRSEIPDLKTKYDSKNEKYIILESKKKALGKLTDFEAVIVEDSKLFRRAIPKESMVPELLTQVDVIARESGLKVTKLSNSFAKSNEILAKDNASGGKEGEKAGEADYYKTAVVSLGVSGSYDQLELFNKNLENSSRLIEVLSFRFSSNEEDTNLFLATFILKSPYLSVETEAVTDEPVLVDISDNGFLSIVDMIKDLKHYDIVASQNIIEDLKEQEKQEKDEDENQKDQGEDQNQVKELDKVIEQGSGETE